MTYDPNEWKPAYALLRATETARTGKPSTAIQPYHADRFDTIPAGMHAVKKMLEEGGKPAANTTVDERQLAFAKARIRTTQIDLLPPVDLDDDVTRLVARFAPDPVTTPTQGSSAVKTAPKPVPVEVVAVPPSPEKPRQSIIGLIIGALRGR